MTYLESSSQSENAVVGFFGRQSFQGQLDGVVLFRVKNRSVEHLTVGLVCVKNGETRLGWLVE